MQGKSRLAFCNAKCLHLLVGGKLTGLSSRDHCPVATFDGTDVIEVTMYIAVALVIVAEWLHAPKVATAGMAHGDAITDNNLTFI